MSIQSEAAAMGIEGLKPRKWPDWYKDSPQAWRATDGAIRLVMYRISGQCYVHAEIGLSGAVGSGKNLREAFVQAARMLEKYNHGDWVPLYAGLAEIARRGSQETLL